VIATIDRAQISAQTTNDEYLAKATALRTRAQEIDALERAGKIDKAEAQKRRRILKNDATVLLNSGEGRFGTMTIALEALRSKPALVAGAASVGASGVGNVSGDALKKAGIYPKLAWLAEQGVEYKVEKEIVRSFGTPETLSLTPSCSR
jgi:hypothetical protein